jgi:hypothetical protein
MPARRGQVQEDELIGPAALERGVVGDLELRKPVGNPDCLERQRGAAPTIMEARVFVVRLNQ